MKANDLKLIVIFICLAVIIFLKSWFAPDGYLSPDSANYLQLAKNLSEGKGFYITDFSKPECRSWFSLWTPGYPLMIFAVHKLTSFDLFWASKLLNLIFIALSFVLLRYMFREKAFWFALVFLTDSVIQLFTYTWSESAFIFGLLCFTFSFHSYFFINRSVSWLIGVFLSSLFLFFTRYAGVFCLILPVFAAILLLYNKDYRNFFRISFTICLVVLIILLYLYNNTLHAGFSTGGIRIPFHDSFLPMIKRLAVSQFKEIIVFDISQPFRIYKLSVFLAIELYVIFFLFRHIMRSEVRRMKNELWKVFFVTGAFYWLFIVILRFKYQFDPIDSRLLSPSTFLFAMALVSFLLERTDMNFLESWFFYLVVMLVTAYNLPDKKYFAERYILQRQADVTGRAGSVIEPTYMQNISNIIEKYSIIPSGSLVLCGNKHINYIRSDISVSKPLFRENMNDYILREMKYSCAEKIFIEVNSMSGSFYNDISVEKFMENNKGKDFIRIK